MCFFVFNHKDFISWTLSHIAIVKDLVELQHQQYLKVNGLVLWIREMKCMYASTTTETVLFVHLSCLSICHLHPSVYFPGPGAHGALPAGGVDPEGDRPTEGEGTVGTSCGVQAQEVDAGYDRGYGMLDFKNKFNIL